MSGCKIAHDRPLRPTVIGLTTENAGLDEGWKWLKCHGGGSLFRHENNFRPLFTAVVIVVYYMLHSNAVAVARTIITLARLGDDDGRYRFSPSAHQRAHDIDLNAYTGVYTRPGC